jgi:hypothetical protein
MRNVVTCEVNKNENVEYFLNGQPLERHFGSSGGYRKTFITPDGNILKLDHHAEWNDWVYCQTAGEVKFSKFIEEKDAMFFPKILDSGVYENQYGDTLSWILEEKVEMDANPRRANLCDTFLGIVQYLKEKYELRDIGYNDYDAWNMGVTEGGWPMLFDFGANPHTPGRN